MENPNHFIHTFRIAQARAALTKDALVMAEWLIGQSTRSISEIIKALLAIPPCDPTPEEATLAQLSLQFSRSQRPPQAQGKLIPKINWLLEVFNTLEIERNTWEDTIYESDFIDRGGDQYGFLQGDWLLFRSKEPSVNWATILVSNHEKADTLVTSAEETIRIPGCKNEQEAHWRGKIKTLLTGDIRYPVDAHGMTTIKGEEVVALWAYANTLTPLVRPQLLLEWVKEAGLQTCPQAGCTRRMRPVDLYPQAAVDQIVQRHCSSK